MMRSMDLLPAGATEGYADLREVRLHFVDYQDCKYLGPVPHRRHPLMLCGGITQFGAFQLGGIALLDTKTLRPVWEVPLTTLSPAGNVVTRNPIDVAVVAGKLRVYLAPDDNATTVFTYEAETVTPAARAG